MVILSNHIIIPKPKPRHEYNRVNTYNLKKNIMVCGCSLFKKLKNVKSIPTGKVKIIPKSELNKLNPYLASTVGDSILDLSAFNNKIKYYYATDSSIDTENLNKWFKSLDPEFQDVTSINWQDDAKQLIQAGLSLHAFYLGIEIINVSTYEETDLVFYLSSNVMGDAAGLASYPIDIDTNPALNGKLSIGLNYSIFYNELSPWPATVGNGYWGTIIHEIGHIFGLAHPFDDGNGSKIMPGCESNENNNEYVQGLFYTNNLFTSIMSYSKISIIEYLEKLEKIKYNTGYPTNLMELDLQSYRFMYNAKNNQKYIDGFVNLKCTLNIVQTLVSTFEGISLSLTEPSSESFILNLEKYIVNPLLDNTNSLACVSAPSDGYKNFSLNTASTTSASILDKESFIKEVINEYKILNVYAKTIINDCNIKCISTEAQKVIIWLRCNSFDYTIEKSPTKTIVTNIINGKVITIENNELSEVFVKFGCTELSSKSINKNNNKNNKHTKK